MGSRSMTAGSAQGSAPGAAGWLGRLPRPWLDRAGRVSPLRIGTLLLLCLPALSMLLDWRSGSLEPEVLDALTHATGLWSIRILMLSLAVTPFGALAQSTRVLQLRRMIGVASLVYVLAHLVFFTALQNFLLATVVAEIVKRPYLLIGFVALVGLVVLGWTSTDGALLRLGRAWKRLHRLVFPVAVLASVHFFLQSKSDVTEAVFTAGLFVWLVGWRLLPRLSRTSPLALLGLAVATCVLTAGLEYLWYATATGIPAHRVLEANWTAAAGLRPAVQLLLLGCGVSLARAIWMRLPSRPAPSRRERRVSV